MRLSASRSPVSTPRAGPSTVAIGPGSTDAPSGTSGSKPSAELGEDAAAAVEPADDARLLAARICALQVASSSISASVVTSPLPTSSASQALDVGKRQLPSLERHAPRAAPNDAVRREALVLEGEVGAEVAAAALLAGERAARDQAGEEMRRRAASRRRPAASRTSPASSPHRAPKLRRHRVGDSLSDCPWDCPWDSRLVRSAGVGERGERRAAAEDEALEQRVRRETVGAVDARAGALACRVEARRRPSGRRGR